mmetsp:Transcript_11964/g.22990  ORF Transcript_11964/g.22990 Transcript_11964/m.22990 type:complete len:473 (-) Transcript_11964:118-1536(-)
MQRWVTKTLYQDLASSRYDAWFLVALLVVEVVLASAIVRNVSYTEIDWIAYMQEVATWWDAGEYDYRNIRGDTGPLVYPAGFLYLFQCLRWMTGGSVPAAQCIFVIFYVVYQGVVLLIYQHGLLWQIRRQQQPQQQPQNVVHAVWLIRVAMGLLCCSKRLHSIFLLRLFNDGPTMLLLYIAMYLFMQQQQQQQQRWWNAGCVVFSLAVSLKMNVLLFAPGLLLLLLQQGPDLRTVIIQRLGMGCALPQLILGFPFLLRFPISYLRKAFELDRVFFYQWTVNWKFLDAHVFVSKPWAVVLLVGHLGMLTYVCVQWLDRAKQSTGRRLWLLTSAGKNEEEGDKNDTDNKSNKTLSPAYIAHTMMVSNFVGIAFARTLHYQFYSWYVSAVPFLLLAHAKAPQSLASLIQNIVLRLLIPMGAMEVAFLTFPATPASSAMLQIAHLFTLSHVVRPIEPILVVAKDAADDDVVKVKGS